MHVIGRQCLLKQWAGPPMQTVMTRHLHTTQKMKKKKYAMRVARQRMKDDLRESPLEPTPLPSIDEKRNRKTITHIEDESLVFPPNFIPEEILHANNLRRAYRFSNTTEFSSNSNVFTDQREGEKWFNEKVRKLDEYKESRRRWGRFLRSCSLSWRVIYQILPKLPNNQAPLTTFWVKQTVDWLSDNRNRYLIKFGATHKQVKKMFREYDNNHFYREWPRDIEIEQIVAMLKCSDQVPHETNQQWRKHIRNERRQLDNINSKTTKTNKESISTSNTGVNNNTNNNSNINTNGV